MTQKQIKKKYSIVAEKSWFQFWGDGQGPPCKLQWEVSVGFFIKKWLSKHVKNQNIYLEICKKINSWMYFFENLQINMLVFDRFESHFLMKKPAKSPIVIYMGDLDHPTQNWNQDFSATIEYFFFKFVFASKYDFTPQDKHVSGTFRQVWKNA